MISIRLVGALLLVSGACSLLFQTAWFREFRLIFGASTLASSAVLAIFMGGLGLGNALLGKFADRQQRPLRLYAKLEFYISIFCGISPFLLDGVRAVYISIGGQETLGSAGSTIVRLVGSALVIGLPTFLMGGTLPAACRAVISSDDTGRRAVGRLYGLNTIGAVFGALVGTFYLFEAYGTRTTMWLACAINLANCAAAWLLASSIEKSPLPLETQAIASVKLSGPEPTASSTCHFPNSMFYGLACLVGFVFFLMEMVWYRLLSPILGGSTFTFGLILAIALAGIGLGGLLYSYIYRDRQPTLKSFILTLLGEAVAIAIPFAMGDFLAILAMSLRQLSVYGFWGQVGGWFVVSSIVVFPVAVISGIQFPVLIGLIGRGRDDVGEQLGKAFAWNTAGAMAGALAGGFGLLTLLGAIGVWKLAVVLLALCAVLLQILEVRRGGSLALRLPILLLGITYFSLMAQGPTAVWRHGGIGAGRNRDPGLDTNEFREFVNFQNRELLWEVDGRESSVGISSGSGLAFIVNGKMDGNAIADLGTQVMLGVVGAIIHPDPKVSLVIGLGTGESAGWLASLPTMEGVDVVEIESAIVEMAERCAPLNHDVLRNSKVSVIFNDAREQLQTTSKTYDVIASEPSNPYRSGISSLYTQEFYRAVAKRLALKGVFCQWLQAYEVDTLTIQSVLATLHSVFPYVEVWETRPGDMVLVCALEPLDYGVREIKAKLLLPEYALATQTAWNTTQVFGVLGHAVASNEFVESVSNVAPRVNTDDDNLLEFGFARTVGRKTAFQISSMAAEADVREMRWPKRMKKDIDEVRIADLAAAGALLSARPLVLGRHNGPLSAVWKAIELDQNADAVTLWRSLRKESSLSDLDFSELLLIGLAMMKTKAPELPGLLSELDRRSPGNALALSTNFAANFEGPEVASERLEVLFRQARIDPTIFSVYLISAISASEEISRNHPQYAPKLFQNLRVPFALHVADTERLTALIAAAEATDMRALASVFESFEPFPIWTPAMLRLRAKAYERTGSAFHATSVLEWERAKKGTLQATLFEVPER